MNGPADETAVRPFNAAKRTCRNVGDVLEGDIAFYDESNPYPGADARIFIALSNRVGLGYHSANPKPNQDEEHGDHRRHRRDHNSRRHGLNVHIVLLCDDVGIHTDGHR